MVKEPYIKCPRCDGHKGIFGHSALGHPATLPCPTCNATGETLFSSLAEEERNPPKPLRFERDDNP